LQASELLLHEFINYPSLEEAKVFGSFSFAEDQSESKFYQLAPKYSLYESINFLITKKHKHGNVWYQGTVKRNKLINFIKKLKVFYQKCIKNS
jgi:hypothetical protein